jgi:glucose/arabinose dehydrogenase
MSKVSHLTRITMLSFLLAASARAEPLVPPVREGDLAIKLTPIAGGMIAPNTGTAAPGRPGRLFVVDQVGIVWDVDLETGQAVVFLDARALIVPLGVLGPGTFDERGLLGLAFHPNYALNGRFYTFSTEPADSAPDFTTLPPGVTANSQSVIREWIVPIPADPASAPGSSRVLLRLDKPQFNHNGGALAFGPDGFLYVSVGDGGSADDLDTDRGGPLDFGIFPTVGHGDGNGQQPRNLLGKILRIDPLGAEAPNGQYAVPDDNPFTSNFGAGAIGGAAGCRDGFCDEIWAYGFRNPFRMSFDRRTGRLWVGDVGQNNLEEVDVVVRGGNYGWPRKEGSAFFTPNGPEGVGVASRVDPGNVPENALDPIAEYANPFDGRAVIGGYVYRGERSPRLTGVYVFGDFTRVFDFTTGNFSEGRLFFLEHGDRKKGKGPRRLSVREFQLFDAACSARLPKLNGATGLSVLGFAEDANGEVYLLANATGVPSGQTGVVRRIDSCDR